MWVFLNDAFLSIVAVPKRPRLLLVRARRQGDIDKVFPGVRVWATRQRDYAFRAMVPAKKVKRALAAEVDRIDYPNFKDSVEDQDRHNAYLDVWTTMWTWGKRTDSRLGAGWNAAAMTKKEDLPPPIPISPLGSHWRAAYPTEEETPPETPPFDEYGAR
jgi:hypothetical protein